MKPDLELERAVATCLLWEKTFYEKGSDLAQRIAGLCAKVAPEKVAALAIKARNDYKLRHVPLFLCVQLTKLASGRPDGLVASTIADIIQRPDEMGEMIAQYWKDGKHPLSAQMKKGLRAAFGKFSEYQFSKWDRDSAIKLRDVMFLVSPKPAADREALYKGIAERTLQPADTWETALSAGADKKETWERLLRERKLGYIALLMNLRNMEQVHVDRGLVESALRDGAPRSRALPFRFVSAARHAPLYAQALSDAMVTALAEAPKLRGQTLLVVDVSGSMDYQLAGKSELNRLDAAGALAVLLREVCEAVRVFTFSNELVEVRNFRGLPLLDGIRDSQNHGGTHLAASLNKLRNYVPSTDRIIVVTDEQSDDGNDANWAKYGYICNVAPYQPGLELSGGWNRINGWSERIVDWIRVDEAANTEAA
jgi:hypothetical protein